MANGTDAAADTPLPDKARPRLKREFEFAFRAHSEISGLLGRTRSTRARIGSGERANGNSNSEKRSKDAAVAAAKESEKASDLEEANSDVVELGSGDEEAKVGFIDSVPLEKSGECGAKSGGLVLGLRKGGVFEKRRALEMVLYEEGTPILINAGSGKGTVNRVLEAVSDKVEEEKPLRRFTRSALKVKAEAEEKSPAKDCGKVKDGEGNLSVIEDKLDDDVRAGANGSSIVLANGDKPIRRFTRSALKLDKSPVKDCIGENNVKRISSGIEDRVDDNAAGSSLLAVVEASANGSLPVLVNVDDNRKVEESPLRRYTRSAIRAKTETVPKSSAKDCLEESNGKGISSGLEDKVDSNLGSLDVVMVETGANDPLPVLVEDSDIKVEDGSLRRFTRSALKAKTESVVEENNVKGILGGLEDKIDELGDSSHLLAVEPAANGSLPLLSNVGSSRNVEAKPFRRITRSALKLEKSPVNDCVEGNHVSEVPIVTGYKVDDTPTKKFPTRIKDLLDSGILEGLKVKYMRSTKLKDSGETALCGVVKGWGVLCSCSDCKGNEVVTPATFELHAGSTNKRPPEYICLENGNTLRDVMNALKNASLETLGEAVRLSIGCSFVRSTFCLYCRGSITEVGTGESTLLCTECVKLKDSQVTFAEITEANEGIATPLTVPKSSESMLKCSLSQSKSQGRLTRKDLRLHKLVFEDDILPDGTEVAYYSRGKKLLTGYKMGAGIVCSCCNSEISPSQFEAHAGWATRRKPFHNIYTSNGVSLHELAISLAKRRKLSANENDDLCQICKDGGDLLCCDLCPRAFHKECIPIAKVPDGPWYCKSCVNACEKEKFVEHNANAIAAGRVAGVDPIEQITRRCIRIVKTLESDVGGCAFCRLDDFTKSFGPRMVMLCDQCEKEFHVGCLKENNITDLKEVPTGKWFCCQDCGRINSCLQKVVVRGEEILPESCLGGIKRHAINSLEGVGTVDIRWRLLSGRTESSDVAVLLSEADAIFHECFDPIVVADKKRGGDDLITSMVHGSSFNGQELGGMYCAVLLVNHVVVSAAIIRIFGEELAELPLVATSSKSQGQGYFQALFSCMEKLLGFLRVKNLILPAAEEAESIWTNKFGFSRITRDELMEYRKYYQVMIFQGTSMLRKPVPKFRIVDKSEGG